MAIELGGDITLEGFDDIGAGELIVVKKLVGRYARKFSETADEYNGLTVAMEMPKKNSFILTSKLASGKKDIEAEVKSENLFVGLDEVLQKLEKEA